MNSSFSKAIQLYKDAYSGHPREIWVLAVLTLINRFGTMVIPFLTVYLTTILGFTLHEAGILAGAFGFGSLAGSYLGGRFSDRFGPNPVIIYSLLIGGSLFILMQFITGFVALLVIIFITAVFGEAYRPALMVAVGNYVPRTETGRTMSLMRMAVNLGSSFAPFAGGFIAALFSYSWLFWVDGVTCILAAIYFVNASGKWQKRATREDAAKIQELSKREIPPYRNKNFILFLIATFFIGFSLIQWFHSIPVFIKSAWGFDERYIGMLMAINGILIILIEMPAIHWIEKGGKIKASILAGLLLISFSFLPFLLSASLIFAVIAVFFFTFGEIFYLPLNSSTAINMSPVTKRGDYMAWYWMTWSLSSIAGPVIGLTFAGAFGFSAFWIFACLLALISFIMYLVLADKII